MKKDSKIYIAGHQGMAGSSIYRLLKKQGFKNLVVRSSEELDLRSQAEVQEFFAQEQPEYVFLLQQK
jgi:GDP-L-fucose synthase